MVLIAFAFSLVLGGCGKRTRHGGSGGENEKFSPITISGIGTSSAATKTIYGPRPSGGGTQPIYWANEDAIMLASAQAVSSEGAALTTGLEYNVSPTSDKRRALIYPKPGTNGLWWGSGAHLIYGLYPAPSQNSSFSLTTGGQITGAIPVTQTLTKDASSPADDQLFLPDMNNAVMWSGVRAAAKTPSLGMTFKPGFTAFEFTVWGATDEDVILNSATLSSTSCALSANEFRIKVNTTSTNNDSDNSTATYTVPAFSNSGANKNDEVSVTFPSGTKVNNLPTKVTFTMFALPASRLSGRTNILTDVKIKFNMTYNGNTVTRSLFLKYRADYSDASKAGKPVEFNGTHKTYMSFSLPDFKNITLTVVDIEKIDSVTENITFGESNLDIIVLDEEEDDGGSIG